MKYYWSYLIIWCLPIFISVFRLTEAVDDRIKKNVGIFNVVKFANDACSSNDGKNGTCYTKDECEEREGTSSGTCAEGYGVCCTFIMGCGSRKYENVTYFESTKGLTGMCNADVCKCSDAVCQLRLDFTTFTLTGPASLTDTLNTLQTILNGVPIAGGGVASSGLTRCDTDQFSVTAPGSHGSPVICGVNTGAHIFIDASDSCNTMSFHIGSESGTATREWAIRITQYVCDSLNLAPDGCLQYYYGSTTGMIQTFNYEGGMHLANQNQNICIRREKNQCRICYSSGPTDFAVSGTKLASTVASMAMAAVGKSSLCCGYGSDGAKSSKGYDCVIIPMATKQATISAEIGASMGNMLAGDEFCGSFFGSKTTAAITPSSICSQSVPFHIRFISDNYEFVTETGNKGFRLTFEQSTDCS